MTACGRACSGYLADGVAAPRLLTRIGSERFFEASLLQRLVRRVL